MEELISPQGAVALAVSALLLVLGYRLARPERGREWVAIGAYALALAAQLLGARGLLPGATLAPGPALRIAGAALLVAGLLVAGVPARAKRRAAMEGPAYSSIAHRGLDPVYAGLGMVVLGQLARAPSVAGAFVSAVAVLACAVAGFPRARRLLQ